MAAKECNACWRLKESGCGKESECRLLMLLCSMESGIVSPCLALILQAVCRQIPAVAKTLIDKSW